MSNPSRPNQKRGNKRRNTKVGRRPPSNKGRTSNRHLTISPFRSDTMLVRTSFDLTASALGVVSYRVSLRNVARAVNGSGTYDDIANIANVYDMYKPLRTEIQYVPRFAINAFSSAPLILATDYDDDDTTNLSTLSSAFDYSNRIIFDPRRVFIYHPTPKVLTSGYTIVGGVNIPVTISNGGFLDFAAIPFQGVTYMYGENFPPNLIVGTVFLSMLINVRGQR